MDIAEIEINIKHLKSGSDLPKYLLDEIFNYLLNKEILIGVEYRIICWLISQYNFKIDFKIDLPKINIPRIVKKEEFELRYLFSIKRNSLYASLIEFTNVLKNNLYKNYIRVIVGGSFTDLQNSNPNDLDLIVLVSEEDLENKYCNECFYLNPKLTDYVNLDLRHKLDLSFLPQNYSFKSFRAYNKIVCLCNLPLYRDKDKITGNDILLKLGKNKFKFREIIEIEF